VKEIGGYLEFERFHGSLYHDDAIRLNCGRNCLAYLIELREIKSIWLPDFLCESVKNVCSKMEVEVHTYSIGTDLQPVYDFHIDENEYLYLVDYYGQLNEGDVKVAKIMSNRRLIIDESHGFFRKPWESADSLYTCRKFFGVSDGAFLYTADGRSLEREILQDESHNRMDFVLGRYERPAGEFFAESKDNNKRFENEALSSMSFLTENLLRAIDYKDVSLHRERNFEYLHERLGERNLLELQLIAGPFMYPLLVENSGDVREALAKEGIYIPTLWPNVLKTCREGSTAFNYAKNILPLPVDQRYGEEDMDRLTASLMKHFGC